MHTLCAHAYHLRTAMYQPPSHILSLITLPSTFENILAVIWLLWNKDELNLENIYQRRTRQWISFHDGIAFEKLLFSILHIFFTFVMYITVTMEPLPKGVRTYKARFLFIDSRRTTR